MTTIVEAPPEPSHDELEALIEEARRRARRRRLLIGGAVATALLLAGLAAGLVLALRGGSGTQVPKGFHAVRARGPVQHARLEELKVPIKTVALADGAAEPTRVTREVWWNKTTGLYRTVYRYDGVLIGDLVQDGCLTPDRSICAPPS